jgi:alpha-amylase/alpha-mannosidase (GH57 family)
MTQVAFLWHMHQPYYEDLVTGEHILPWVRLHALKDYYGMVALLREFPGVRVTFNLVPSLLVQLEAFAANRARDSYLDLGLKPAAHLTEQDIVFILQNFFHAQRTRMIEIYPRYAELLARRGRMATPADAREAAQRFSTDDLRDLQVWQKLAWLDPFYIDRDARVRALIEKGRLFSEEDKLLLRDVELELLNLVIPEYREAAARGQVELSTSPFYHPILPLLCDTDIYKRTHPESALPRRRFRHPEDAFEQLTRAVVCHERLFGRPPTGLWPSEGSVSDAMVPLVAKAGFTWMATDEQILGRTLGFTFSRDASGHVDRPDRLYVPYRVKVGAVGVGCAFRDHALSDLIGFSYAGWASDRAADDFVARLADAGRGFTAAGGREEPVVFVILDGENAWEHFEGGGRPFLRALYGRLAAHPELRTVTMSEACLAAKTELPGIFPGSWIDSNFYIWIGHRDDQRAWSQLADAREALDTPGHADAGAVARARDEVLIAEGSDWFWWYGDDHSSEHDLEFDDLFRRHLRNVYGLLLKPVPDELFVSNISAGATPPTEYGPTGLLTPILDGEDTSYFEWLGAGTLEIREISGAMHQTEPRPAVITQVRFGFDYEQLYVSLAGMDRILDLLAEGYELSLKFLKPESVRFSVRHVLGRLRGTFWDRRPVEPYWVERGPGGATVAAARLLEVAIPLADLLGQGRFDAGSAPGDQPAARLAFFVAVYDPAGAELERHPAYHPIETEVPDRGFEARNWTV